MKKTLQDQECNKNHLVDHLLDLGIFKICPILKRLDDKPFEFLIELTLVLYF